MITTAIGLVHAIIFTLVLCFVGSVKRQREKKRKVVQARQDREMEQLNALIVK